MMKPELLIMGIFFTLTANAQNYLITFSGKGASTTVSTVKVENLTSGASVTLNGNDALRLNIATDINSIDNDKSSEIEIYPNPMINYATLEIYPPVSGDAIITIYEMTGKPVAQTKSYLENLRHDFKLSGLKNGFYLVSIRGKGYQFSGKLICNGNSEGIISIEHVDNILHKDKGKVYEKPVKGTQATFDLAYNPGERLKFTGFSGNYITILTDIPLSDKTINFNFAACTDGDNNNYAAVEIGNQIWMAENLKTSRYNDGTAIPNITDKAIWAALGSSACCDWGNDPSSSAIYGKLYNWYTLNITGNGGKNVCPAGWHVPADAEWTTLVTWSGGDGIAGDRLKESGTMHWFSPNTGATDEEGYAALPGGYRIVNGNFSTIGWAGLWWSSTVYDGTSSWYYNMAYNLSSVNRSYVDKGFGISVRCLKD
jgi:uncharacterized protein (TIGR02145 family)